MSVKAPRVLTISFELRVPRGLPVNIRTGRVENAISRIVGAVQGLVPTVFPWADQVIVRYDWSYRWWEDTEKITLPVTAENTVPAEVLAELEEAN
ncbi:hypothetical protein GCM10009744_59310 [Kribbella alba]|uniref:Uncharacterized protein n=1 Tax=Kribbella alba TaxID=190197 RepID=A0ABN2FSJ4_9ACTN